MLALHHPPSSFPMRGLVLTLGSAVTLFLLTGSHLVAADSSRADLEKTYRDSVRPFIETYCIACHGNGKTRGGLDLAPFTTVEAVAKDFPHWVAVLEQLKSREMPPPEAKKQPSKEARDRTITWIEAFRKSEAKRTAGDPGLVLARRLSHAEYDNTIRDLTGVDLHPAREFPVDPANETGFDNSGESLAMSPALVSKYLAANRLIADHLVFQPDGFRFAPYPVLTDTDKDKYAVRRIVDFYLAQPTDLASYFQAAWEHRHRAALGRTNSTLAETAKLAGVSPRYLPLIWDLLEGGQDDYGPVAALRSLWRKLPAPTMEVQVSSTKRQVRQACVAMRDQVRTWRETMKPEVPNLFVRGMNRGAQALVLWKDRQMAANRRTFRAGALERQPNEWGAEESQTPFFTVPKNEKDRASFEVACKRFCSVIPDAFYISERGRVFLDPKEDQYNTGRLLSAGFHNQMGYFRDDQPLCELILDDAGKQILDKLWLDFEFASNLPLRMHSGLVWFERSESSFLSDKEFDFARAEDKDVTSPAKFKKFAELYVAKTRRTSKHDQTIKAIEEHFPQSEANIRRIEKSRIAAEPAHLQALNDFAARAFRRPLTSTETAQITAFYQASRQQDGLGHEDAVRDTLVSILMMPQFCFRADLPKPAESRAEAGNVAPLSDEALASRLSYFLWSSTPDRELLDLAAKGQLHHPEILQGQARRMLRDRRVETGLATQFGGNWLDFRRFFEHNAVDRSRFPSFDNDLREAMYQEPVHFLLDIFQNDRSVLDFLGAKHTFVNATLAKHYGMERSIKGKDWVRVEDADQYGRGGLLPMAVFMTKNAPGLRTSPVKRGYWVVSKLLGERIPAPPPNVPELPADEKKLAGKTLRETLAKHREDKSCAACHARFDSFGLAFEGFGPIGEKRSVDLAGQAIDTLVSFPGGSEGDGLPGLRQFLMQKRSGDFLDNLCRKLLAYALGRGLQLSDEETIALMRARLSEKDHRFSVLVETIVQSPQFLNARNPQATESARSQ